MRATPLARWSELPQPFLAVDAAAAGLGEAALLAAVRRHDLVRVAPSVYTVRLPWLDLTARDAHRALTRPAARLVEGSFVSHASAAVLHGLPAPQGPLGKVSLTVRDTSRTSYPDDWRRVLHGMLPDSHVTAIEDVPVTTVARTVIDCFRQHRLRNALAIADGALRNGGTTLEELREMRVFQRRWPGVRLADEGLDLADPLRESWLESASVAVAWRRGFARPESQVHIHDLDGKFVARVDLLWRAEGVVGECDGLGKYQGAFTSGTWDPEQAGLTMVAERERERALEQLGFAVARWGTSDLRGHGDGMVRALTSARRRAAPGSIRCLWRPAPDEPLRPWAPDANRTSGH